MKIELNQEVIIVGIGSNAKYTTPIYKAIVSKIGRKWFYVESPDAAYMARDNKFSLEDGKCDGKGYMPEWAVYESEEVYNEHLNRPKMINELTRSLNKLTYKQLVEVSFLIKSFNAEL